jgi:hypothetical protein
MHQGQHIAGLLLAKETVLGPGEPGSAGRPSQAPPWVYSATCRGAQMRRQGGPRQQLPRRWMCIFELLNPTATTITLTLWPDLGQDCSANPLSQQRFVRRWHGQQR